MNKEDDLSVRACRLYEELRRASLDDSILLREEDWKRIEGEVKVFWPDLGRKIYECGVYLSDIELRICWMARMHIPLKGMATVPKRCKAAISLARTRLYEKMTGTKGSGKMFDDFIRQL